ncbi:hypothetical protein BKA67DRAFT_537128 [Truncatella angustata]|uniref:Uncharacterized protein n=1 Tax=Truncatella angustata TaxID=152316 RepID=A0A9P8UJU5_9PEZI|nr:uncharacterized protein BKA67DRAFT_537128 [Truncatella angustata]KAH6653452.1 hypothetical protein BKA67DRAFT_537128 [Truncatella angustata]
MLGEDSQNVVDCYHRQYALNLTNPVQVPPVATQYNQTLTDNSEGHNPQWCTLEETDDGTINFDWSTILNELQISDGDHCDTDSVMPHYQAVQSNLIIESFTTKWTSTTTKKTKQRDSSMLPQISPSYTSSVTQRLQPIYSPEPIGVYIPIGTSLGGLDKHDLQNEATYDSDFDDNESQRRRRLARLKRRKAEKSLRAINFSRQVKQVRHSRKKSPD